MKYVLKKPITLFFMIIVIILGITIGYDVYSMDLLTTRLSVNTVRIIVLISFIYIDSIIFRDLSSSMILFRNKNLSNFFKSVIKSEVIVTFIFSLLLFIPIILLNISMFLKEFKYFILMIINFNVMISFFICIIRLIDVRINRRTLSSIIFMSSFIIIDFLMGEFFYDMIGLSSIFVFPIVFNLETYFLILILVLIATIMLTILSILQMSKKDYLIKSEETVI